MSTVAQITATGDFKIAGTLTEGDRQPAFSRSSVAYKSNGTQVAANVPRFEAGKFGQAVMVEEGTTNKIETEGSGATQDWTKWNHWGHRIYWQSETQYDDPVMGKVFQGVAQATTYFFDYYPYTVNNGKTYTISIWLKASQEITRSVVGYIASSVGGLHRIGRQSKTVTITTEWQRFTWTITVNEDAIGVAGIGINISDVAGITFYAARPQFEEKPYATSFINTTRSPETLTIPTAGVLNPQEGAVEFTIIPQIGPIVPSGEPTYYDFTWGAPGANGFLLRRIYNGTTWQMQAQFYTETVTVSMNYTYAWTAGEKLSVAFRWSSAGCALFVNGALKRSDSRLFAAPSATEAYIGYRPNYRQGNALYDDLRISSRARTDEEIAAAYQSGLPLPVDADTTYKLNFDNSLTAIAPLRLTSTGDFKITGELIEGGSNFVIDQNGNLKVINELIEGVTF